MEEKTPKHEQLEFAFPHGLRLKSPAELGWLLAETVELVEIPANIVLGEE